MSYRRMIHSDIWTNEDFGDLGSKIIDKFRRRLLFIGLFSLADDDGRISGSSPFLKAKIFPYDDVSVFDIERDLKYMSDKKMIYRYKVGDKVCVQNKNWERWQKIRRDLYKQSELPAMECGIIVGEEKEMKLNLEEKPKKPKGKHTFNLEEVNDIICYEIAEGYSVDLEYVKKKRESLRLYCGSKAIQYADYKLALMNWIRRDIEEGKAKRKVIKEIPKHLLPEQTEEERAKSRVAIEKLRKDIKKLALEKSC